MTGKTISHYKIVEKLGRGGMGIVYKAEDTKLNRLVALKFLPAQTLGEEEKTRFVHEAKAAAALNHPNICTIYEIDEADGHSFIAMEYIEGQSLQEIIVSNLTNLLKVSKVFDYAIQIVEGLQEAHDKGIVHRDIKPANIMVTNKGQVKIMDFGLAKLTGHTKLTLTGTTLGTMAYMSPEQIHGKKVDQRTDLWSLGVVLYELVTSHLPFEEDYEAAIMYAIVNESPSPPTELRDDLPAELEKIILKCLRKEAKDRYSSARQVLTDLNKLKQRLEREKLEVVVSEAAPKQKRAARKESERRQTTVLCANLSGYSEMLEALDPEEASAIVDACFKQLTDVAQKYQGTIDKIVRNDITVLFGLPKAIEAAPQKAVNAAIAMRNRLRQFNQEQRLKFPLDIQVGIDSGIVIAGAAGDQGKEFTFIGEPVELASQLMEVISGGQIYVGPLTHRYTKNDFEFKELSPVSLKGKKQPVTVFELISTEEKIYRPVSGSERMIYSEMVGRDKELDKLKLHVLKVINGEGSIVSVIGEAGIGKSRLIAELRKIEDLKKVTLLEGRALSIGKNLSYHPIINIIRNWAGITERDSESEAHAKLEKAIHDIHPDECDEVFPFVATMMSMKLTGKHAERVKGIEGEAMEKLILKNVRELMMKGADRRPLVYILQDLHWADMTSIELLESLYRLAENHSILFINVLRPNYPETGDRLVTTIKERYSKLHTEIILEPLDDNQCEVLLQNLLKASGLPTEIRTAIANRAEGNPFFIEEVVRSFIDEGALELQNGKFKVTKKIDSVVIPETIQDVLMVRIDRLDEQTKSLLKNASVIGRYFFYKILAELAKTIEDMDERLEYLEGVQLILESKRMEELEYLFKHALAQEVTYESILLKKRKELHLQVANAIESVFSQRLHEFYGMLALHYSKGENLEKAEEYLIRAGEEALKAAASSEALNYYQEALNLYLKKFGDAADTEKLAMLEKNIALAFFNKGHFADAFKHFDKALVYTGKRRTRNSIISLFEFFVNLMVVLKNLYFPSKKAKKAPNIKDIELIGLWYKRSAALANIESKRFFMESIGLIKLLNKFDLTKVEGWGGIYSGGTAFFSVTGISFSISKKFLEASKKLIAENDIKSLCVYKAMETQYNYVAGSWEENYQIDESLVNADLQLGELFYVYIYIGYSFYIAIGRGDFEYAARILRKMSEIAETFDYDFGRLCCYTYGVYYNQSKRKLKDISKTMDKGLNLSSNLGLKVWMFRILGVNAKVQILSNDMSGAERSLSQARQILAEAGHVAPIFGREFFNSQFLFDVCQFEDLLLTDHLRKDKSIIKELMNRAHKSGKDAVKLSHKVAEKKPEALRLMGTLYWLENKQKQALKYWGKSIKVSEHLGARPELARTDMEVGKRMLEKKSKFRELNGLSAEGYLDKARALFEEMALEWDLEQLENVRRTSEVRRT